MSRRGSPRGPDLYAPTTQPPPPAASQQKAAPDKSRCARPALPDRCSARGGGGWRGGQEPPRPGDPTPGWSPGGGSLTRAGTGGRRRAGGRSPGPAGRRTHRQTDAPEDRPPDGQGFGHTAAWPLRLPGRNGFRAGRDRSREKGRRRRRRRRPGEGKRREGAREQGGGARQAAGRRRKEEARRDSSPPVTWERLVRDLPTPRVPAGRGMGGGGTGHRSPAPPRPESAPYPSGHPSALKPKCPP